VGKPPTFSLSGRARFDHHDEVGAEMAEAILRRLRFSGEIVVRVSSLVHKHMQFMNIPRMRESTLRRFMAQPEFGELLELHRLDCIASHRDLGIYDFLKERMRRQEKDHAPLALPLPLIRGDDLIEMGLEPGPVFGEILREVQNAQLEGTLTTSSEARSYVRSRYGALIPRKAR
jgi:tRNA nucleotidyltransferase/poly(A) polymerase